MNRKLLWIATICSFALMGCNEMGASTAKKSLTTEKDKYSYAFGAFFGMQANQQLVARDSIDLDLDVFVQAFKERYKNDSAKYLMNDSLIFATLNEFSMKHQAEKMAKDSIAAEKNLTTQKDFLEKNKSAEGVVTTESGLQYQMIHQGTGVVPTDTDIVSVHYTGTLLDGSEFDNSLKRGAPAEFPVNAVIPGWTEILKLMKTGSKVKVWIPSDLGYGPRGRMPMIPGHSLLVFEMELLETKAPEAQK